jgi:hypothetical protein
MEKHHVPTVYLTTSQFNENAHLSAEDNGVPKLRIIALPADKYYSQRLTKERVKPVAAAAFEQMIDDLTRPVTQEEIHPQPKLVKKENVKVTGESEAAALENFNRLFVENHWSDGLPLIPPTPERVKWMLSGTNRSAIEKIGTVSPRNGMATVENVAINAVMAGAIPEYFPIILAAMDALVDKSFDDLHFLTSTGSFNLVITVSGAIAKEVDMNSGLGLWSYGSRANLAIGRAVRLATINIGHAWPGENDMALVGRPNPTTFMVVAENQDYSPWEPYHVSQGYKAEDSCVTLDVVGSYGAGGGAVTYGGGAVALVPVESILNSITAQITRARSTRTTLLGRTLSYTRYVIVFNPEVAQELQSRLGYTRESLRDYLYARSSVAFEDLRPAEIELVRKAIESGEIPKDRASVFQAGLKPGGKIPMLLRPEDLNIIVAGGIPGYTIVMSGYQTGIYQPLAHITKPVLGATLTKAGSGKPALAEAVN